MHISHLSIEGFRSLKNVTIKGMGPVTIFHGLNNSGKSNILAALETIFSPKIQLDPTVVAGKTTNSKRSRSFYEGRIENFRDNFYFNQIRKITFKASVVLSDEELSPYIGTLSQIPSTAPNGQKTLTLGDGHEKACNMQGEIVYTGEVAAEMTTNEVDFNSDYPIYRKDKDGKIHFLPTLKIESSKAQPVVEGILNQMSDCFRLVPANRYLYAETAMTGRSQEVSLTPGSFKQWLYNAYMARNNFHRFTEIQRIFNSEPFKYGELGFAHEGNELEIMVNKNGLRLPINRIGSGLQQILYLIAVIVLHKNKVLAIEELEINLSPAAQKEVFEMLKTFVQNKSLLLNQVVVTSHSDYFEKRNDVKCFSVGYDQEKAQTEVAPWSVEWRKKHFSRD